MGKVVARPKRTLGVQLYVPELLRGMGITLKHFFINFFTRREIVTVKYPEEKVVHPERYRGLHRLMKREDGSVRCTACMMCATICPANCIHIEAAESPWDDREKYPAKFEIDELRCIFCGMCEEACPVDAIELTTEYDIVGLSRQEMVFDKEKLLSIYDITIDKKPM